ncbi:oligogalacturonate-specific porin KdgM family protein [Vibrio europaeus]|uniref:oligogalacturonate-specific porin KdgM family protein n=1 Tax=Vibrio oreintalis group TaxID=1891919 RepID=UPI00233EB264|nr:oligogalacturonate-specific porin KdgM family protein [Vibrio europaeus]MDC5818962.1 oligogalacturonate-specific porin KdgM family protein [Vibrio europaeus]MDC5849588.1 oligogalacturonate-specific porin KdgM family protein [Vibrio europaeus]MDC5856595.1 oligogalacturonate-specific porin KdgM family protein [Vibrio europaeus]MDC5871014.1 oligogalacturonate-specific porin KdgM family protein [Vibrio europaeus]
MKLQTLICAALLAGASTSAIAGETKLDVRFGYNTTSENRDSRVKFMHTFDNGFYFSAEAAQLHNDAYFGSNDANNPDKNGLQAAAQEFEASYKFNLNDDWYWSPGLVTVTTSDWTEYRPYLKLGTTFDNGVSMTGRYRYNWSNDANGKQYLDGSGTTRGASNQFDLWISKNIGDWGLMYNPRYRVQDGVDQGTGRDDYWEHTIMVNYKVDETWTPYMELVSVDETYVDSNGNRENDYAVRFGVVMNL